MKALKTVGVVLLVLAAAFALGIFVFGPLLADWLKGGG